MICCCLRQLKCLICGSPCACCCSFCPSINESTSTRLMYALILLACTMLCAGMMSPYVFDDVFESAELYKMNASCIDMNFGEKNCFTMTGSMAVYRLSFAMVLFFAILMILTVGVKTSVSYRGYIHNGFWLFKIVLLICLIILSFKVPFYGIIRDLWMYTGMIAACVYIIINMLLIIELAYSWTEKTMKREKCKLLWYLTLIMSIIFFIGLSIALTIYLYINFVPKKECYLNNLFISFICSACFFFFLFAIMVAAKTRKTYIYLLPTAFLSAYVLLQAWSAMTSIPRTEFTQIIFNQTINFTQNWCYSDKLIVHIDQKYTAYINVILSILLSVYSSVQTSSKSKKLGIEVNTPQREVCFGCCVKRAARRQDVLMKKNGQNVIPNEADGVKYSYSFFHFIFLLATFHNMMQLTNWTRPDTAQLDTFGQSIPTVYMKAGSAVLCILIFGSTLLVSCFCPNKELSGSKSSKSELNRSQPSQRSQRTCQIEMDSIE